MKALYTEAKYIFLKSSINTVRIYVDTSGVNSSLIQDFHPEVKDENRLKVKGYRLN